jgi:hypothetical protein
MENQADIAGAKAVRNVAPWCTAKVTLVAVTANYFLGPIVVIVFLAG